MKINLGLLVSIQYLLVLVSFENGTLACFVKFKHRSGASIEDSSSVLDVRLLGFHTVLDGNLEGDVCDQYVKAKTGDLGVIARMAPKGDDSDACEIKEDDVKFLLYTKHQPNRTIVLPHTMKKKINYEDLKKFYKVIIFIHGFAEITEIGSCKVIKDAYLSRKDHYVVIVLDWSELSSFPWYFRASQNAKLVAEMLKNFLESYSDNGLISLKNVHLIGFSLGAHIAGIAGKKLRRDLKIGRITGLDPAFPEFDNSPDRLDREDAYFVDVIHTDCSHFGISAALGHADFYPNDGYAQPGCGKLTLLNKSRIYEMFSCSHSMSYRFYVESVRSPYNFPAVKCEFPEDSNYRTCDYDTVAYMGFAANKSRSGTYFLETNEDSPYGQTKRILNEKRR